MEQTKANTKTGPNPTICLAMIVKNESKIIERMLKTVLPIVDYICITDTGSDDNTVELIESFCKENEVDCKVPIAEWKNFGHNRTISYQNARELFPEADYVLLLDADMMLVIEEEFNKSLLTAERYMVKQITPGSEYWNTRIISTKLDWVCIGATHEYWDVSNKTGPIKTEKIESLWIDDVGDGGSKADKYERDIRLLKQDLGEDKYFTTNKRNRFYLAQSYYAIGKYEKAITNYKLRIECGGWFGEVWQSIYRIGMCYKLMGKWNKAVEWFNKAINSDPNRVEPVYHLCKYFNSIKNHQVAYVYGKSAVNKAIPKEGLFIEHWMYQHGLRQEMGICCYYVGDINLGRECCNTVISSDTASEKDREIAKNNMVFYTKK